MRHQKQGLITSYVSYIEGYFFVKLRGWNIENYFLNTQLPLNEYDNNFEEQYYDINYRKTVKKYMMLVGKTVISLVMMFICLVLDAV